MHCSIPQSAYVGKFFAFIGILSPVLQSRVSRERRDFHERRDNKRGEIPSKIHVRNLDYVCVHISGEETSNQHKVRRLPPRFSGGKGFFQDGCAAGSENLILQCICKQPEPVPAEPKSYSVTLLHNLLRVSLRKQI